VRISKILLPVDFSPRSTAAAHHAKTLACRFHSELILVHVFELSDLITSGGETGVPPEWFEERRVASRDMLKEFCGDDFRNMPVRRMLIEGDVARSIVNVAHDERVDLIVIPTHGYGGFRRFILGSVTAKILHDADCPVLTGVHLEEVQALNPIFFRRIVCAIDLDSAGEKALRWAGDFAAEFNAHLTVVHALPSLGVGQARYFDQAFPVTLRQVAQERLDEFQEQAGTAAELVLEPGPVAELVRQTATSQNADLVVIGRHENPGLLGRLRGNAYAVVRESPCPVVSV